MRIAVCVCAAMITGGLISYFLGPVGIFLTLPNGIMWGLLGVIWQESAR